MKQKNEAQKQEGNDCITPSVALGVLSQCFRNTTRAETSLLRHSSLSSHSGCLQPPCSIHNCALCSCFLQAILGNEHTSAWLTSSQGVTISPPRASSMPTDTFIADFGTHKLNKGKLDLLPRGLFHQCQQWHLIAGLTSHTWQKAACWSAAHSNPLCFWPKILLHPNLQVSNKKAEIPKALFGVLPQSLWLLSGGSIARRGSQAAEESTRSPITAGLHSALGLKIAKEEPGVGPKAEQSGIKCIYLFERTYRANKSVCSDHSMYCFKSRRN